jgi:hypothetical protein
MYRCRSLAAPLTFIALPTLIALLAAAVVVVQIPNIEAARLDYTRMQLDQLVLATDAFHRRMGRLPFGVTELVAKTLFENEPHDVWDRPFRFFIVDQHAVFASLGKDGKCGGEGANTDLFTEGGRLSRSECEARDR